MDVASFEEHLRENAPDELGVLIGRGLTQF